MKRIFFIIFLTILCLPYTILYTKTTAITAQEYASLTSSGNEGSLPNLAISKELISLDLRGIEVKDALKYLAEKANLNIVPTNDVSGRVTLLINDAPIDDIFEILIRSNKLAYEKIGSIYSVMTESEYKQRYGKGFDDIRQVKVFHLQYVIPDQAFTIIDSIKSAIGKVLVEGDSGTILVLDTPEKIQEISETLDALEHKSSVKVFSLRYATAEEVAKQLRSHLDLKKVGSIKADERTNQVIVQTLSERMNDVEQIIAKLDQKTKEVLIDARIIQVKLTNSLSEGVQWEGLFELAQNESGTSYLGSYPLSSVSSTTSTWRSRQQVLEDTGYVGSYPFSGTTSNFSAGTPSVGTEQMHIGVVGNNDFDVLVNYLQTLGDVKILSNPKLAVTNNQEARIHVGERQAYITTTTTAGQTTTTVSEEVTFLDVGLQLHVTPIINDQGYVTLKIKPEISSVIGSLTTSQNNKIPIIDTSTAETTVMVKDGATVAIGGLRREEVSKDSQHFPLLNKLPLIGMLFKSETNETSRSELLIMITAHVIEGDALVTGDVADPGKQPEKAYQDYNAITEESDLSAYEKQDHAAQEKMYQDYPEFKAGEEEYHPAVKPLKDE
ncbi:MAG: secretin N-terminal domain-containing protein [Candidatus Omnitrophica bacterium]|nr:secretin N-terminal domain-containing protein [Candidatus Omnitrophota bacterium]